MCSHKSSEYSDQPVYYASLISLCCGFYIQIYIRITFFVDRQRMLSSKWVDVHAESSLDANDSNDMQGEGDSV